MFQLEEYLDTIPATIEQTRLYFTVLKKEIEEYSVKVSVRIEVHKEEEHSTTIKIYV